MDVYWGPILRQLDLDERATVRRVGGGEINAAYIVESEAGRRFVKLNAVARRPMFETEARALAAIHATGAVRAPNVILVGECGSHAFLALECLELRSLTGTGGERLGAALARLHRRAGTRFGWPEDNYIGTTEQRNAWHSNWSTFFLERRLRPQCEMLDRGGEPGWGDLLSSAESEVRRRLEDVDSFPALLHGDLWAGNAASLPDDTPVIFDPASYYGDPEADLAMTELFGGFDESFYRGYDSALAPRPGYDRRRPIYQLYHVLNHANLFAGGYLSRAEAMLRDLGSGVRT